MNTNKSKIVFQSSAKDFEKIPGAPIAYWISANTASIFSLETISKCLDIRAGVLSGNDNIFIRNWFEVQYQNISMSFSSYDDIINKNPSWLPITGGGGFRKWFGALFSVINSKNNFSAIKNLKGNNYRLRDPIFYFKKGLNWPLISTSMFGAKLSPEHVVFGNSVRNGFPLPTPTEKREVEFFIGLLCSSVVGHILNFINPTVNFNNEDIAKIPICALQNERIIHNNAVTNIAISQNDWNAVETSWNFKSNPLVINKKKHEYLATTYTILRKQYLEATSEMHRLEEENNRIFIEAYGLREELTPEVSWNEITLTCNPWYRYGVTPPNPTCEEFPVDETLEARLKADTMKEFLSYAVGCMFGRYSLDKPGLVLANQGETLADYLRQIPQPTFRPDEDNVLPILDEDWFADDIVTRFNEFLKTTFGEENFYENLAFIEDALGKDVRSFFLKDFYKDHLQRYHNRPIYWLFSSPKGAFNALVYMHRYRPETVGMVLTYLRSHITKVSERIHTLEITIDSPDATASMKSKAIRECAKLQKNLQELEDYERDVLYPLATEKIDLDLDDGVKVNYRKFGNALFKVKGLETKED